MSASSLNILVAGSIASTPNQGGWTWAVLQYLLGLKRLGHEVHYLEVIDADRLGDGGDFSPAVMEFRSVMSDFGFRRSSAMLLKTRHETLGVTYSELTDQARRIDLLINISGVLQDSAMLLRLRRRLYLDLDPGFTQLWSEVQKIDMHFATHTHHATIGLRIGRPDCRIPTCGINWITTPQPIVLEYWAVADDPPAYDGLTTLANWRGYGSIEYDGVFYGQKAHSLRELMTLPTHTRESIYLALAIHPDEGKDLAALKSNGWRLLDPADVAPSPKKFQAFVQASKAEFGLAKSGYVHGQTGWVSDRSLCYLASGRPVLAQETGFSACFPTGEGLLTFTDQAGAVAAIDAMNRDYSGHRRAARGLAERYFDSDKVLGELLDKVM